MKRGKILCLCLVFFCLGGSAFAEEVRISAAASLTDALKELGEVYRQSHPQLELQANFASSGSLAKQIVAGAPADIYICANPKWLDYLQQQGLVKGSSVRTLLHNRLVFVGLPTLSIQGLPDLQSLQRIALASPKSAPAGRYAEQALTAAGLYSSLLTANRLIFAKDVRQALIYADRGEVDGAFVYRTDALLAQQARLLFEVPEDFYPQIVYPAALTTTGAGNAAAGDFFSYLFSAAAQQVFRNYGFLIPE